MKRLSVLVLCLVLCLALVACGSNEKDDKDDKKDNGTVILEEEDFTVYYDDIATIAPANTGVESYSLQFTLKGLEGVMPIATVVELNGVPIHSSHMSVYMVQMVGPVGSTQNKKEVSFSANTEDVSVLECMGIDKITSAKVDLIIGNQTYSGVEVPIAKKTSTPDYSDRPVIYENEYFRIRQLGITTDLSTIPESKRPVLYMECIGNQPVLISTSLLGKNEPREEIVGDLAIGYLDGSVETITMVGTDYIYLEPGQGRVFTRYGLMNMPMYAVKYVVGEGVELYKQIKDNAVGPYPDYQPVRDYETESDPFRFDGE